jgi:hypothetical protein
MAESERARAGLSQSTSRMWPRQEQDRHVECVIFHVVVVTPALAVCVGGVWLMQEIQASSTGDKIAALAQLLRAAMGIAENLSVADRQARRELLDSLAIAQLNALRLAEADSVVLKFDFRAQ